MPRGFSCGDADGDREDDAVHFQAAKAGAAAARHEEQSWVGPSHSPMMQVLQVNGEPDQGLGHCKTACSTPGCLLVALMHDAVKDVNSNNQKVVPSNRTSGQ